jgi:hypothetical protein
MSALGQKRTSKVNSLPYEKCIESRVASAGNQPPGGCQTSENVAMTRDDSLAMLRCVSIAATHNIVRQGDASSVKLILVLLETLKHIVCLHRHTGALLFKLLAAG